MTYLTLVLAFLFGALLAAGWYRYRLVRQVVHKTAVDRERLKVLRQIDQMILSNVSLEEIAERITAVIADTHSILGGVVRNVDQRAGSLTVLAVSPNVQAASEKSGRQGLMQRTSTAAEMTQGRSRIAQAVNERRVVTGELLRDFECPLLKPTEADAIQKELGIRSVVVYPIVVEDRLSGAVSFFFAKPAAKLTKDDHSLMQSLADEAGIAMENTRLLCQLEDMNSRLEEANMHLQTLDATKDEFISITSHQLRSPLTAVKGYLSMLLDRDFGPVAKRQEPVLRQIAQSTSDMINVLNDLLSVSKINAEHFELTRAPANLEDIVTDVVSEMKPLAQEKALSIKVVLPQHPIGVVYIDPLRIRQVLINFIDNAIKYTPQGSIEVRLSASSRDITCLVTDHGIGIPKRELSQMFTKFYRALNARKLVTLGTGLGLFVAKRVIEDHHGNVIVKSVEGKGSTFGFTLPRAALSQPDTLQDNPTEPQAALESSMASSKLSSRN